MRTTLDRLRPLLIGLIALLITAGIAFAGRPSTPANGPAIASEASGRTVPVAAEQRAGNGDEDADGDADENLETVEETATDQDAAENCATDPSNLTSEQLGELRHGSVVCWAAQQETPAGYDNHGQWVSEWARKNRGQSISAGDQTQAVVRGQSAGRPGNGNSHKP